MSKPVVTGLPLYDAMCAEIAECHDAVFSAVAAGRKPDELTGEEFAAELSSMPG